MICYLAKQRDQVSSSRLPLLLISDNYSKEEWHKKGAKHAHHVSNVGYVASSRESPYQEPYFATSNFRLLARCLICVVCLLHHQHYQLGYYFSVSLTWKISQYGVNRTCLYAIHSTQMERTLAY